MQNLINGVDAVYMDWRSFACLYKKKSSYFELSFAVINDVQFIILL